MKKKFVNAFLLGTMLLSMGVGFVACNGDDIDNLERRMAIAEANIRDNEAKLSNALATAKRIASYEKNENGNWVFTFTDGQSIEIVSGATSSVPEIAITENEEDKTLTITLNGKSYTFSKEGSDYNGLNGVFYMPEYVDDVALTDVEGKVTVKFKVMPKDADLVNATFTLNNVTLLKTRNAGEELFVITETAKIAEGIWNVTLAVNEDSDVKKDETYTAALEITYNETTVSSDFFKIKINAAYAGNTVVKPIASCNMEAIAGNDGAYKATIPAGLGEYNFNGQMDFKKLYKNLPAGATFELGAKEEQNNWVANDTRYAAFLGTLKADGMWDLKFRPGDSGKCNGGESMNDAAHPGLLILVKDAGGNILSKIYWAIVDEIAACQNVGMGLSGASAHFNITPTTNTFDIQAYLATHSQPYLDYTSDVASVKDGKLVVAEWAKAYCAQPGSGGLNFTAGQFNLVGANGESDDVTKVTFTDYASINSTTGVITFLDDAKRQTPMRIGIQLNYHYDYGSAWILPSNGKLWLWFNRTGRVDTPALQ